MERALLVTIKLDTDQDYWPIEDIASEMEELAKASGVSVVDHIFCQREKPTANFFIGKGKAEEIAQAALGQDAQVVIFSQDLSGTQQRNLEELIGRKTIDRTQLILDIFACHAKSPEGKTQVELAQLQYLLPRLVGQGLILSRLGGGIGTRGPGEQKLEVDRRQIRKRIDRLQNDLKLLSQHRATMRKKRQGESMPSVALVGYTNAGKSTLINALTQANQLAQDNLFTTLDPVAKNLRLTNGENVIISDTVGFLYNLPHHLIEAFKATLEEVAQADLLIHVLDAAAARVYEHAAAVKQVLDQLNLQDKSIITALNKIDLLDDQVWLDKLTKDFVNPVAISAQSKLNLDVLSREIERYFSGRMIRAQASLLPKRMDLVDLFYREGKVKEITYLDNEIKVKVDLPKITYQKLLQCKDVKIEERQIN